MLNQRRKRYGAIAAAMGLLASLAALVASPLPASADTAPPDHQRYACFSALTNTYSTFQIPLGGTGSPGTINTGQTTTFSDIDVTFAVNKGLAAAGIGAGALDFVTPGGTLGTADPASGGGDGVNSAVNTTNLRLTADNTTESAGPDGNTGTADDVNLSTSGGVNITFFIIWDGSVDGTGQPTNMQILVETSPGSWSGSGTGGLVEVPMIPVVIAMSPNQLVTSNGDGDITLRSARGPLPANPAGPPALGAERNNAPLVLLINLGVQANFYCWPGQSQGAVDPVTGLPGSSVGFTPAASAAAIDTVEVVIPPTAPDANDDSAQVGAGQDVDIAVLANDTDPNGNLDPASVVITTPPTAGTATVLPGGVVNYANTDPSATSDSFQYTVQDTGDLTSAPATVSIDVLGDLCTAPCSLNQIIVTPVIGASMTLEQDGLGSPYGDFVVPMVSASSIAGPDGIPGTADDTLASAAPIILNGQPQLAVGNLYELTVTNARGTDAGWDLTGQVTDFTDGTVPPNCPADDPTTWNNHCIPGDNLGWIPSASVAHTQVLGDVASVDEGSSLWPPNFLFSAGPLEPTGLGSSAQTLCSSDDGVSGGTFTCGGGLGFSVPASAAATGPLGGYVGILTLTLA